MRKLLILLVVFGTGLMASAQTVEVTSVQLLKGTEKGGFYHPVFDPQGAWLLTTAENYAGLNQHWPATGEMQLLTADAGAGYDLRISEDGNTLLYRKTEMRNNLRYTSLNRYDLAKKKQTRVEKATREKITPVLAGQKPVYVKGNKLVKASPKATPAIAPFIQTEDRKLALYSGNTRTVLTPNGEDASYFWASVSPDGQHIVYAIAAGGTYVCTIDGKNPVWIGKLNAPQWLNNQWIVGMDDKDDGDFVIASTLVVATIDGLFRKTLSTPQIPTAMYPAASADGKRIACNSLDGKIYLIDIDIQK